MRNVFWVVGAALMFFNVMANAQSSKLCRVYEFAEMQSMSKEELTVIYCSNTRRMDIALEAKGNFVKIADEFNKLASRAASIGDRRGSQNALKQSKESSDESSKHFDDYFACSEENSRIVRLIKKDDAKFEPPNCGK